MSGNTKKKGSRHRHAFRFKLSNGKVTTWWAKVVPAKKDVYLELEKEHVIESIKLRGVGNTQTCSMAICAGRQAESFPHAVEGFIDWFYSRAFIVSKLNRDGLPSECYEYMHSDSIAQLNDTRGGQKKLLAELEAAGGKRIIHLRPVKRYDNHIPRSPPSGVRDGRRTRIQARGAALRFAVAQLGGVPT